MPAQSEPPPAGPAWDHPPTQRGLARYRRRSWLWIVAGVLLLLVVAMAPIRMHARAERNKRAGWSARGTVTRIFPGTRQIRFVFEKYGYQRIAVITLPPHSPGYRVDDAVEVIYDPDNPSKVQLAERERPAAALIFLNSMLAAPFLLGIGVWALWFAAQAPAILKASSWRRVDFEYRVAWGPRTRTRMVRLDHGEEVVLFAAHWRVRYLRNSPSGTLWVAEQPGNNRLVLTANAGADLFRAKRSQS